MSEAGEVEVLVLGGGPGGYALAARSAQAGLKTALVEAARLGGVCLTQGCIPSKALIELSGRIAGRAELAPFLAGGTAAAAPQVALGRVMAWKDGIVDRLNAGVVKTMARAGVEVVQGWGTMQDARTCLVRGEGGERLLRARNIVLATGSEAAALAAVPFGGPVISSTEALGLTALPRHLAVIGAGYIGLELGMAFRKLGARVTVLEAAPQILSQFDAALSAPVRRKLQQLDIAVHTGIAIDGVEIAGEQATLNIVDNGTERTIAADKVLVTVGRRPRLAGWGRENLGIGLKDGAVRIDERCMTDVDRIWAIGDVTGGPMLAHRATAQAHVVADQLAGKVARFDPVAIPAICFTDPEIVSVGALPQEAGDRADIAVAQLSFAGNGRALTLVPGEVDGFLRVVARRADRRILGIQAVGPHVSELSGEFVALLEMGAVVEDVRDMIHAHPTLGELLHEAADLVR
ncbi:MAG: dihydrolipoyl dehydrogenase [Reyranellaceae bacterium]